MNINQIKIPNLLGNATNIAILAVGGYFAFQELQKIRARNILEKLGNNPDVQLALQIREALHKGNLFKGPDEDVLFMLAARIHDAGSWTDVQKRYRQIYNSNLTNDLRSLSTNDFTEFYKIINGKPYTGSAKSQRKSGEPLSFRLNKSLYKIYTASENVRIYNYSKDNKTYRIKAKDTLLGNPIPAKAFRFITSKGINYNILVIKSSINGMPGAFNVYEKDVYAKSTFGIIHKPLTHGNLSGINKINSMLN